MQTDPNGPTMMSEATQLQKLIAKADLIYGKGPAGRLSLRETKKEVRSVIKRIQKSRRVPSPHKRKERSHHLFAELAVAHAIHCRCDPSRLARTWLAKKIFASNGVKVRANSKRENLYARLIIPGCHSRDYHRYGLAIKRAHDEQMAPSELFRELCVAGGMTRFIDAH